MYRENKKQTSICRIHLKFKCEKTIETEIQAWQNVKFEVTRFDLTHVLLKKTLEDRQKDEKKSSMEKRFRRRNIRSSPPLLEHNSEILKFGKHFSETQVFKQQNNNTIQNNHRTTK